MRIFHTEKHAAKSDLHCSQWQSLLRGTGCSDTTCLENLVTRTWCQGVAAKCELKWTSMDFLLSTNLSDAFSNIWPIAVPSTEDKDKDIPLTGPKDAAFRHYCSCYPGGKPTYNIKLKTHCCKEVAVEVLRGFSSIGIAYGSLTRGPTFDIFHTSKQKKMGWSSM